MNALQMDRRHTLISQMGQTSLPIVFKIIIVGRPARHSSTL